MKNDYFIRIDAEGRQVIAIAGTPYGGEFVETTAGLYKEVFQSGDELVPTPDGGWKIASKKGEIFLPKDGKWKIEFSDNSEIFPVPYKNIKSGKYVVIHGSGCLKNAAMVYIGNTLFRPTEPDEYEYDFFEEMLKKAKMRELEKRYRQSAKSNYDDDDEEEVMRALRNGNGDLLGF